MDIPTPTEPIWPHCPTPLRAPPKVSSTMVGGKSSVPTLNWCGHQRRDVHTDEDEPTRACFIDVCVCVCVCKYHTVLRRAEEKGPPKPNVLIHEQVKKKNFEFLSMTMNKPNVLIKKNFELKKKLTCVSEVTFLS